MCYKICVVTTTRADYGILTPLLSRLSLDKDFDLSIVVGGTHLSDRFGHTVDIVKNDNYGKIIVLDYLSDKTTSKGVCESAGNALKKFSDVLSENDFDAVIILGDRYEMLAISEAAFIHRVPIVHIHGGEVTEGALDDNIRHAITKLSSLHFVAAEEYRNRVIQMGESPECVYNVGALGIEVINSMSLIPKNVLLEELGISKDASIILMTYHPETNKDISPLVEIKIVMDAICDLSQFDFIITKSNADEGGNEINEYLEECAKNKPQIHLFDSLGSLRYLSVMKYANIVLGNSSSGIIEAPSMETPTINIGDRQKGRLRAKSVFDVELDSKKIKKAIENVMSIKKESIDFINPYGGGETSLMICELIKKHININDLRKRTFYDLK